ncbi:MAG: ABC transporter ATP-binding protein [Myxococcales bacterium]
MDEKQVAVGLERVTKVFGRVRAVVGASGVFWRGEVAVVEGANGSGKSTLLGLLAGKVRPTAGVVTRGGGSTGWLGHEGGGYGDLTGRENIELTLRLWGGGLNVSEVVERVDAMAFADRPFRTLSRGQRQRVALACAIAGSPELLLLDEPTAGLDSRACERLVGVVREEAARGAGVVVVTHDTGFASEVGGVRWRVDRGRLESIQGEGPARG